MSQSSTTEDRHEKQKPGLKKLQGKDVSEIDLTKRFVIVPLAKPPAAAGDTGNGNSTQTQSNPGETSAGATESTARYQTQQAAPLEIETDALYRFYVIVALEWTPNASEQQQLVEAFKRASAFLYDVTDGYMAFGWVLFGGMELMEYADIQLMASNRLNPRSWVNGLNDPNKYMPIRAGRGVWNKDQRASISWVEPEGYRTLIHEWAHYALALRDEYLETHDVFLATNSTASNQSPHLLTRAPYTLIVPRISLATESIMGSLVGTSEIVPLSGGDSAERRARVWEEIIKTYSEIKEKPVTDSGPYVMTNVPSYLATSADGKGTGLKIEKLQPQELSATGAGPEYVLIVPSSITDEHCWIYIVKGSPDQPRQIIAQGTFDGRSSSDHFQLLNAQVGNWIVLIGKHQDGKLIVLEGKIDAFKLMSDSKKVQEARAAAMALPKRYRCRAVVTWTDASPPLVQQNISASAFPTVDVIPLACAADAPTAKITVQIHGNQPDRVWLFPLGELSNYELSADADTKGVWETQGCDLKTLDGHVLLRWNNGKTLICTFSQGGGPATHVAVQSSPITAGSAEGNVMIFFKNTDASQRYGNVRVITTLVHGSPDALQGNVEPRSYLFSIAGNEPLPINLTPTLIMYFDSAAADAGGDLIIHRLDTNNQWQPMPTYIPSGSSFAAMPMNEATATNLLARTTPRVEHYRLFWVPRSGSAIATAS